MRQPVGVVGCKRFGWWYAAHRIFSQRKRLLPLQRSRDAIRSAPQSIFAQSRSPALIEPLLERAALVRPAVVVVGSGNIRSDAREMWGMLDCRQKLCRANVRSAEHSHFSVCVRKRSRPLHGVKAVVRFVFKGIPVA